MPARGSAAAARRKLHGAQVRCCSASLAAPVRAPPRCRPFPPAHLSISHFRHLWSCTRAAPARQERAPGSRSWLRSSQPSACQQRSLPPLVGGRQRLTGPTSTMSKRQKREARRVSLQRHLGPRLGPTGRQGRQNPAYGRLECPKPRSCATRALRQLGTLHQADDRHTRLAARPPSTARSQAAPAPPPPPPGSATSLSDLDDALLSKVGLSRGCIRPHQLGNGAVNENRHRRLRCRCSVAARARAARLAAAPFSSDQPSPLAPCHQRV